MKIFIYSVIIIVAASIVAGFFIVGSPQTERMRRFDQQRVENLTILQSEIINYWIQKDYLPTSLNDLKNDITGFVPPSDPESNIPYNYRLINKLSFELCANFKTTSKKQPQAATAPIPAPYYEQNQNWSHDIGHICFTRTIDPELYSTQKTKRAPTY
ncbi:hypothetical protein KGQ34_00050 [Patescibacteria group bacterium]|nr:hypothetical protein [Patescibacteria group bacterium]